MTTPAEIARGQCRTCGGMGRIIAMNSMWLDDKLFKERCGICSGTGRSTYRDDPAYVRWQARCRETFPRHPDFRSELQKGMSDD